MTFSFKIRKQVKKHTIFKTSK